MKILHYSEIKGQDKTDFLLQETQKFWDAYPCGKPGSYEERSKSRYTRISFVLHYIIEISKYSSILEIGTGPGTDAITLLKIWDKNNTNGKTYTGIDLSTESLKIAEKNVREITFKNEYQPKFLQGNAEQLEFPNESFDCVYSSGVFHHVPNIKKAISEMHRVLKKEGDAHLYLYNRYSVQLFGAYLVRLFTSFPPIRKLSLKFLEWLGTKHYFGTLFHEGLLTPILNSYTKKELEKLFSEFSSVQVKKIRNSPLYFHVTVRK